METPIVTRMQLLLQQWEDKSDHKVVFLRCYQMMTKNMLLAIDQQEFKDPAWVNRLLHRFADYYFVALEAYEQDPATAPVAWQLAHSSANNPNNLPLQNLLLGINAHINYDLVLSLVDLLGSEWSNLSDDRRAERYFDHCHVNEIISRTIDAVQDQILEPSMPVMDLLDQLLGKYDELIVSRLITQWRDNVWESATRLLEASEPAEQSALLQKVKEKSVRLGEFIFLGNPNLPAST